MSQFFHLVLNVPSSHTRRPSQMAANGEQYLPFLPVERANLFILKGFALLSLLVTSQYHGRARRSKQRRCISLFHCPRLLLHCGWSSTSLHYLALSQDWQQALPLTKAEVESDDGQKYPGYLLLQLACSGRGDREHVRSRLATTRLIGGRRKIYWVAFDLWMVALEELNGVGEDFSCSFEPAPKKKTMTWFWSSRSISIHLITSWCAFVTWLLLLLMRRWWCFTPSSLLYNMIEELYFFRGPRWELGLRTCDLG